MLNDADDFSFQNSQTRSLVEQMLQIKDYEQAKLKSFGWIAKLICLSPTTRSVSGRMVLEEIEISAFDENSFPYITISYSWHPAPHESGGCRSFWIKTLAVERSPNIVRDTILRRAVHYVQHHNLKGFWIDRQCLDQNDLEKHQIAMHSMDRLYAQSPCSVGMLTLKVDRQWKLDALTSLLDGSIFQGTCDEPTMSPPLSLVLPGFWRTLRWFIHLLSDPWWRRSWIFQEEYCAGLKMYLLLSCTIDTHHRDAMFGNMQNEIEISAIHLRTQLSIFGEACQRDSRLDVKQKQFVRKMVLRRAGRYQLSFQGQSRWGHSLSSAILADLKQRRIKYPRDLLPITANYCSYAKRLDEKALDKQDHVSLGLSLLVQALLNGEILDNRDTRSSSFRGRFVDPLRHQLLVDVHPPEGMRNLTFLKHCRWVETRLCADGILTTGYVWRIVSVLNRDSATGGHLTGTSTSCPQSSGSVWTDLKEVAETLRSSHSLLAGKLSDFVCQMQNKKDLSFRDEFMTAMAREVATAWRGRRSLIVGDLQSDSDGGDYCGIFVPSDQRDLPGWIFTSWHNARDVLVPVVRQRLSKHVSLEINSEPVHNYRGLPLLETKRWINGICFFHRKAAQEVAFPWPKRFLEKGLPDKAFGAKSRYGDDS